jgi:hypothetical protein
MPTSINKSISRLQGNEAFLNPDVDTSKDQNQLICKPAFGYYWRLSDNLPCNSEQRPEHRPEQFHAPQNIRPANPADDRGHHPEWL